ncbi:hypothetical protein FACS1894170_04240 [Planctomycetales bacterium]|nr:hypothetical protein FACS1894170_04240 [Planctomycetales bacterium]
MKIKSFFIGLIIFAVLTVVITVYSGSLTGRWGTPFAVNEARTVLKSLPLTIGNWEAAKEGELDKSSITMLGVQDSYITRSYKNTITQNVVHITIILGPSGRVTVHTPEICFGGKDYVKESERVSVPINIQIDNGAKIIEDSFWKVDFVGKSLDTNNRISFYYAHSDGGPWVATKNARWEFSKHRYAYKLQAQAYSASSSEDKSTDTVKEFLNEVLPEIHAHLTAMQR